ncbi:pirin family protein [Parvularcula sp. LCG005]|uniref:pirin family protein n=1 Tax=Parvularcula sp. LCG005 TaxID=3078805 RepID=UPI0029432369|nr:pirin family protein [Parvularcula sp. LCG005]WOI54600.1 pirin family protein [Parvularcula sp. LCG005]
MTSSRTVKIIHPSYRDDIGNLTTRRPLPGDRVEQISPFLFLNHHGPQTYSANNNGLPFGPHPHRGFETVTFILDGSLMHKDTGGHESVIEAGGVQWMTAGSGLIHAELSPDSFKEKGGDLEILQLWVNLPASLKMTEPRYVGLQDADLKKVALADKAEMTLIAGQYGDAEGPVPSLTGVFMSILRLKAGAEVTLSAPRDRNVFFYIVSGAITADPVQMAEHYLIEFNGDGDEIALKATKDSVILFGHGDPIDEPIVAQGPFVMNTPQEIRQAYADYQAGLFDKQPINV